MPNRTVRNTNHNRLGSKNSKKKVPEDNIQVDHGNAPILTVKFLDLIYKELKKHTAILEQVNG